MNWLVARIKKLRITHNVVTNILLLGILLVLGRIAWRMPPTTGDMLKEIDGDRNYEDVEGRIPYVRVWDTVTVEVDSPLEVEIEEQPVEVIIDR